MNPRYIEVIFEVPVGADDWKIAQHLDSLQPYLRMIWWRDRHKERKQK